MAVDDTQTVFRTRTVSRLRQGILDNLDRYRAGTAFDEGADATLRSAIKFQTGRPELSSTGSGGDHENAIRIYRYIGAIRESQAVDERLWTFMTHVDFSSYCSARWPIGVQAGSDKTAEHVRTHWFVKGGKGGLRRNAISRLWWAAHLTTAPLERNPTLRAFLQELHTDDEPHLYTGVMLSNQDIYQGLIERNFGSNDEIRMIILEVIRQRSSGVRSLTSFVLDLFKHVNLLSTYRELSGIRLTALYKIISDLADRIMAAQNSAATITTPATPAKQPPSRQKKSRKKRRRRRKQGRGRGR